MPAIRIPAELTLTPRVVAAASARFSAGERARLIAELLDQQRRERGAERLAVAIAAIRGLAWSEYEALIHKARDLQAWLKPEPLPASERL